MAEVLEQSPIEVLYVLAISSSNEFLGFIKLSQGTVDRAAIYPWTFLAFLLEESYPRLSPRSWGSPRPSTGPRRGLH